MIRTIQLPSGIISFVVADQSEVIDRIEDLLGEIEEVLIELDTIDSARCEKKAPKITDFLKTLDEKTKT